MKEIALIGIVQSMFFLTIVVLRKEKQLKDYLLICFFIFIGAELLYRYLLKLDSTYNNSPIVIFDIVYWALFGPVLIFYVISVIKKNFRFTSRHLVHLFPLFISLVSVLKYFLNRGNYNSFIEYYNLQTGIIKIGLLIWEYSSTGYILFTIFILLRNKRMIKNYFSNIEKKEMNWLLYLTLGFACNLYLSYVYMILRDFFGLNLGIRFIDFLALFLTIYVFGLGIFGYKQEGIFFEVDLINSEKRNRRFGERKYQKTGLSSEERELINQRLIDFMLNEKPYLDSEININYVAGQNGTTVHKLSQVINEEHKRNFFDFINSYRISEVKLLLYDPKIAGLKIESIGYDCGFNSKSSFYSIFKKHTHLTPTEFRNSIKDALQV